MTDQPTTITCPVCDAPNAARSLFCAECGTPLTSADGDTTSIHPGVTDSQSTAVIPSSRSWTEAASTRTPAATSQSPTVAPLTITPVEDPNPYLLPVLVPPESRRGFWLGLVALLLILIVLGLWIWGGVLAADTRNTVSDLFQ